PDLERNGDYVFYFTSLNIHAGNSGRAGPHISRTEVSFYLGVWRQMFRSFFPAHTEVSPILCTIQGHVATSPKFLRGCATYMLIGCGRLHSTSLTVCKHFRKVYFNDLYRSPVIKTTPGGISITTL